MVHKRDLTEEEKKGKFVDMEKKEKDIEPYFFAVKDPLKAIEANAKLIEESGKYLTLNKGLAEYSEIGIKSIISNTKRTIKPEELVQLVWDCGGDLRKVANVCRVRRPVVRLWLKKDGSLHILDEIEEAWNDAAESVINEKILVDKSFAAAQFRLETKGKERGYYKKAEVETKHVINVQLEGDSPETLNIDHEEASTKQEGTTGAADSSYEQD